MAHAAVELSPNAASAWERRNKALRDALAFLQYAYPIVMLIVFLVAITVRSIWHSNANPNVAKPVTTGPGGKPLPATDPTRNFIKRKASDDVTPSQKRVFEWLSLAAALTFVGNSVNVIVHALCNRNEHWWCGQPQVVSSTFSLFNCVSGLSRCQLPRVCMQL
jgi:hypothetical protein